MKNIFESPEEINHKHVFKVIEMDSGAFTEWVLERELTLVFFYAPNCAKCEEFAPKFEEVAHVLAELSDPIELAKVDGVKEKPLSKTCNITEYPSLRVFNRARHYNYTYGWKVDGD